MPAMRRKERKGPGMVISVDESVAGTGGLDEARHAADAMVRRKTSRQRERLMANVLSLGLAGASQEFREQEILSLIREGRV
jgi:hypothetical protein